jgi:uncharacterized protein (DUF2141 family)
MKASFSTPANITAFILAACLLGACARQGAPTGGPKDTTPPKVDTLTSTRNFSTRFTARRIELVFDEWIALSDVGNQVIVSPTLSKRPEITLKGKKITVVLPEEDTLRPNTTYTINFGTAVKDFHEGNPAENLRFVFSTGDYLDSLTVSGSVLDAFSGEPLEKMSVMLYDITSDSVVRKEKPYYMARTDKVGLFAIPNVRAGNFKIVAIEDLSGDLKWDGQNERIGFADSLLSVNDSARAPVQLKVFKNQSKPRLLDDRTLRYGLVKLVFSTLAEPVDLRPEVPELRFVTEKVQDTLLLWYDMPVPAGWQLFVGENDTVKVKDFAREDFLKNHKISLGSEAATGGSRASGKIGAPAARPNAPKTIKTFNQPPGKPAVFSFNSPVSATDTSRWLLVADSMRVYDFSVAADSAIPRNLKMALAWKFATSYKLTLLPGAVTDFYGVSNADTLELAYNVHAEKQLGGLNLTLEGLIPRSSYVLQLISGNTVEEERRFVADLTTQKLTFTGMPAAAYTARLVEDRNGNGRWDSGDYFAHRQPEAIFTKKLDPLRANWELEISMRAAVEDLKRDKGKK